MLEQLRISNLAVVDDLAIRFEPGLNLLTGETGAGKSIVVDSLALLFGRRADPDLVRSGRAAAVVEATFRPDGDGDGPASITVRREIRPGSRSSARWNGTPIPLGRLRSAMEPFLSIHGQHSQQGLLRPAVLLDLLDEFGGLRAEREAVRREFLRLKELEEEIRRLKGDPGGLRARCETLEFQVAEIRTAAPEPGEDERLRRERDLLRNAERFLRAGRSAAANMESEAGVAAATHRLETDLRELAEVDPGFERHLGGVREFSYLLQEIGRDTGAFLDTLDRRPDRLAEVESRLSRLQELKTRYGGTIEGVLARREEWERELERLRNVDASCAALERERGEVRDRFRRSAARLSGRRSEAGVRMAKALEGELQKLAFPRSTRVRIGVLPIPAADSPFEVDGIPVAYGPQGWDAVDFRIAANPGEPPRPLARIASGGELSRVLLALQSLVAGRIGVRTVIFDEIDSGVGAEVAAVVGERLRRLAAARQVICITHWAQVAAGADCHFRVDKEVRGGRTRVSVKRLRGAERRREIARMLGSRLTPESSLRHARELLAALSPGQGGV